MQLHVDWKGQALLLLGGADLRRPQAIRGTGRCTARSGLDTRDVVLPPPFLHLQGQMCL